uniref:Uncharacterized protein n=1 Tax=Moniliophthora roreri TaxID=221103 RepID=A0A0W0G5U5_MONRR
MLTMHTNPSLFIAEAQTSRTTSTLTPQADSDLPEYSIPDPTLPLPKPKRPLPEQPAILEYPFPYVHKAPPSLLP